MTVSALRTITVGAPASIYGVCPVQPSLGWPMAQPDEVLDYSLDVSALLSDVDDTITSASLAVSPSGAGELTASALAVQGGVITVWLADGVAGRRYLIRVEAITAGGRTFEWLIGLSIDPALATWPPTAAPSPAFGTVLTSGGASLDFSNPDNSGQLGVI